MHARDRFWLTIVIPHGCSAPTSVMNHALFTEVRWLAIFMWVFRFFVFFRYLGFGKTEKPVLQKKRYFSVYWKTTPAYSSAKKINYDKLEGGGGWNCGKLTRIFYLNLNLVVDFVVTPPSFPLPPRVVWLSILCRPSNLWNPKTLRP